MTATNNQLDRINELASEIAQKETEQFFDHSYPRIYADDPNSDEGGTIYTEEAQDVFNQFYDIWAGRLTELVEMEG